MAEIAVGIDLGTSNTCVALMKSGNVEVLANAFGERTSASVVHFHEDGSVEVGNSAKAKIIQAPAHTVSSAKRLIGRYYFSEEVKKAQAIYAYEIVEAPNHGVRIEIREEEFSLPEISAMVLREMKQIAERHAGEKVTKAAKTDKPDSADTGERNPEALDQLLEIIESLSLDYDAIWGSMIKQTMRRVYPGFNEAYMGYRNFADLLKHAESEGYIELEFDRDRGNYKVRLLDD